MATQTPPFGLNLTQLQSAKSRYEVFIDSTERDDFSFALTPKAECSPYARCFAIFGYRLLGRSLDSTADGLARGMVRDLDLLRIQRRRARLDLLSDKAYLQLLTFTMSALSALDKLEEYPLESHIKPFLGKDIAFELKNSGVFDGRPRSGNHAMFLVIILLYASRFGFDTKSSVLEWERLHRVAMNQHGFWGNFRNMSYSQFQNGYHQYEIFEYLQTCGIPWLIAANNVSKLADSQGHFAPYPGGGGCYDYDAVFFITNNPSSTQKYAALLKLTALTLMAEQNDDGGFCESRFIRPRSIDNLFKAITHMLLGPRVARWERLCHVLTLMRPKHDRIHTHWSKYSREWKESNLWDSWFRMITIARIDCAFNPDRCSSWGFINFPGLGFHHGVRVSSCPSPTQISGVRS